MGRAASGPVTYCLGREWGCPGCLGPPGPSRPAKGAGGQWWGGKNNHFCGDTETESAARRIAGQHLSKGV